MAKNYASNNSNPMLIADQVSEDYSITSDMRDINKISNQKLHKLDQISIKSKKSMGKQIPLVADNRSFNNASNIDQSINISVDLYSHEKDKYKMGQNDKQILFNYDSRREETIPDEMMQDKVDESLISGVSQYKNYLESCNNDYQESPMMKNRNEIH